MNSLMHNLIINKSIIAILSFSQSGVNFETIFSSLSSFLTMYLNKSKPNFLSSLSAKIFKGIEFLLSESKPFK